MKAQVAEFFTLMAALRLRYLAERADVLHLPHRITDINSPDSNHTVCHPADFITYSIIRMICNLISIS